MAEKDLEVSEESTHFNPLEMVISSKGSNTRFELDVTSLFTTEQVFKSREDLVKWAREVGTESKFVVIIKTSDAVTTTKKPRLTFGCERGGKYVPCIKKRAEDNGGRRTGTKKCGCPFLLKGRKLDNEDDWRVVVVCGLHNHDTKEYEEGHSFAGRLSCDESVYVARMSKNLVAPKSIYNDLKKENPNNAVNMKVIYNRRHRLKVVEKAGRTNMQLLMNKVFESDYLEFNRCCDSLNYVKDLFFAHPFGVDLLHTFPRVLMMDCTYKTNCFNYPLFEIIGMTSTKKSFNVAFAFLEEEKEENYQWALERLKILTDGAELPQVIITDRELTLMNAIEKVFPDAHHMLCTWHISKNVQSNCKKLLGDQKMWEKFNTAWNMVVYSSTEKAYHHNLQTLYTDFARFPEAIEYVTNSWLTPYKERFVSAWTDSYMHFGNTTSNRTESQHSKIKRQILNSQHNYEAVWTHIDASFLSTHSMIREQFEKSKMVVPHLFRPSNLFEHLKGRVSIAALELIFQETKNLKSIGKNIHTCRCEIRRTHGLPCAHEIAEYAKAGHGIPLSSVHAHWTRLSTLPLQDMENGDCQEELELIQQRYVSLKGSAKLCFKQKLRELGEPFRTLLIEPPVKKNPRGCPKGSKWSKVDKSTKRDPSAFEYCDFDPDLTTHEAFEDNATKKAQGKRARKKKDTLPPRKVHGTRNSMTVGVTQNSEMFKGLFQAQLRPYIENVRNVRGDGNCGFRVIVAAMGYGENERVRVRDELLEELHSHTEHYMTIYQGTREYQDYEKCLQWCNELEFAPQEHWLTMPNMGHLIAFRYNCVVYFISNKVLTCGPPGNGAFNCI